ncbi:MAG: DUF2892 domain-containing protein [Burkholderiales bacterium]
MPDSVAGVALNPKDWLVVVPLATGVVGWCPPYAMLGFSTCSVPKSA